jgi:hypothetical protein
VIQYYKYQGVTQNEMEEDSWKPQHPLLLLGKGANNTVCCTVYSKKMK